MDEALVFRKVGIALGLGLLVGLQRERAQSQVAGIRTFGLITVLGAVSALLGQNFGGWLVGLGAVAVTALLVVGNLAALVSDDADPGLTTEVAALLMYGVGAYVVDLDAITLSAAQLADRGQVGADTGWRIVLAASLANLVGKGVIVGFLAGRSLLSWILVLFGAALAGGLLLLLLWPAGR